MLKKFFADWHARKAVIIGSLLLCVIFLFSSCTGRLEMNTGGPSQPAEISTPLPDGQAETSISEVGVQSEVAPVPNLSPYPNPDKPESNSKGKSQNYKSKFKSWRQNI